MPEYCEDLNVIKISKFFEIIRLYNIYSIESPSTLACSKHAGEELNMSTPTLNVPWYYPYTRHPANLGPWLWPLFVVFVIVFLPIFVSYELCDRAYEKIREIATAPKPLPKRRRALSISSQSTITNAGRLGCLPFEIRAMIYQYALSGGDVHLFHIARARRLSYCQSSFTVDYRSGGLFGHCHGMPVCRRKIVNGKLALLKTCRHIYNEGAHILYATNSFQIDHEDNLATFVWFSRTIRPERLASIRDLGMWMVADTLLPVDSIPGSVNDIFERRKAARLWMKVWTIIAHQMPGLANLKVSLVRISSPSEGAVEQILVKPMLAVRGLTTFELEFRTEDPELFEPLQMLSQDIRKIVCANAEPSP